mmetsp:Transcript_80729/g.231926  ORF Transcript_80729/g.231926 Transcript_80729/m.231926 type:complete len:458 (-) Transcript_80729:754-2127(-)
MGWPKAGVQGHTLARCSEGVLHDDVGQQKVEGTLCPELAPRPRHSGEAHHRRRRGRRALRRRRRRGLLRGRQRLYDPVLAHLLRESGQILNQEDLVFRSVVASLLGKGLRLAEPDVVRHELDGRGRALHNLAQQLQERLERRQAAHALGDAMQHQVGACVGLLATCVLKHLRAIACLYLRGLLSIGRGPSQVCHHEDCEWTRLQQREYTLEPLLRELAVVTILKGEHILHRRLGRAIRQGSNSRKPRDKKAKIELVDDDSATHLDRLDALPVQVRLEALPEGQRGRGPQPAQHRGPVGESLELVEVGAEAIRADLFQELRPPLILPLLLAAIRLSLLQLFLIRCLLFRRGVVRRRRDEWPFLQAVHAACGLHLARNRSHDLRDCLVGHPPDWGSLQRSLLCCTDCLVRVYSQLLLLEFAGIGGRGGRPDGELVQHLPGVWHAKVGWLANVVHDHLGI